MSKRIFDFLLALAGLLLLSPILLPVAVAVWAYDRHSPFYWATRSGLHQRPFQMLKLRSMVVNAEKSGVASTSADDSRITPIGRFIRSYKLDEISQLYNVLRGEMSLVGPRPNLPREVAKYSSAEMDLLSVRPGITDFASIVFSDEGEILRGSADPDLDYDRLIRPWKSELGLLYVKKHSLALDIQILWWTIVVVVSRPRGLAGVVRMLKRLDARELLCEVAGRRRSLDLYSHCEVDHESSRGLGGAGA